MTQTRAPRGLLVGARSLACKPPRSPALLKLQEFAQRADALWRRSRVRTHITTLLCVLRTACGEPGPSEQAESSRLGLLPPASPCLFAAATVYLAIVLAAGERGSLERRLSDSALLINGDSAAASRPSPAAPPRSAPASQAQPERDARPGPRDRLRRRQRHSHRLRSRGGRHHLRAVVQGERGSRPRKTMVCSTKPSRAGTVRTRLAKSQASRTEAHSGGAAAGFQPRICPS